jgi:DNA-directed RNA polymerase subunit RPC12/RpoP
VKVDCNECGRTLSIGEHTRFVTCAKCAARLVVKRSDTSTYTEMLSDVTELKEELARLDEQVNSTRPAEAAPGSSESWLRIIVGLVLVASDIYWWVTDPTLQSLGVRILLLAAGGWLILSGIWKTIAEARQRSRANAEAKVALERRREELARAIKKDA